MNVTEIVLLIIGGLFFAISFFLPDKKEESDKNAAEEEIKRLVNKELESARSKIDDMVDETVNYSIEKTERALERLSNEKIMAVDEYSETVLKKINDNHNEAVFLYDMLNDKDEKLKNTGDKINESINNLERERKELEEKKRIEEAAAKKAKEALVEAAIAREEALEKTFIPFAPERLELVDGYAVPVNEASGSESEDGAKEETEVKKAPARKSASKKSTGSKASAKKTEDSVTVHLENTNDGKINSNEAIRKLHEEGLSNMQIARELGLGVGEVKLVIDLFAAKKGK